MIYIVNMKDTQVLFTLKYFYFKPSFIFLNYIILCKCIEWDTNNSPSVESLSIFSFVFNICLMTNVT